MLSDKFRQLFNKIVDVVFAIILLFIMLGIAVGALQLFSTLWELLRFEGITGKYIDLIADVLTLYILVELSRSLVEYFNSHRLRLTFIVDAAIVFVIREILIGLFKHNLKPEMIYALTALILVLGVLRIASIIVYQREQALSD
jgi:uncharacterized membrane protein (DUF373 family)